MRFYQPSSCYSHSLARTTEMRSRTAWLIGSELYAGALGIHRVTRESTWSSPYSREARLARAQATQVASSCVSTEGEPQPSMEASPNSGCTTAIGAQREHSTRIEGAIDNTHTEPQPIPKDPQGIGRADLKAMVEDLLAGAFEKLTIDG